LWHYIASNPKRSLWLRNDVKCTSCAMKKKRNRLSIILRERLVGQESELKTQRQQSGSRRKILRQLKTRDWWPECPKQSFTQCWLLSPRVWAIT
jgi:hypothetical protein